MARLVNSDEKHSMIRSQTFFAEMLRYVSCWPAKLASGMSSHVAEDHTAKYCVEFGNRLDKRLSISD